MSASKKKHPILKILLLFFLFSVTMTALYGIFYIPSVSGSEIPPFLAETKGQTSDATAETTGSAAPEQTVSVNVNTEEKTYERKPGVYNILVIGKDYVARNTDVLFLVSYDTENQSAAVAQIPRDTYCDGGRINRLYAVYYAEAENEKTDTPYITAAERLSDTVESVFAVRVDYFVTVDTDAFRKVVDAIGGVDVTIPCDMDYDDPAQNLSIHLTAGFQHLNGEQAEQFVRFRHDYVQGDIGRTDAQKLFLTAFYEQVKDTLSPLLLPKIAASVLPCLKTDLTLADLLFFAQKVRALSSDNLTFFTFPGVSTRRNGTSGAWLYILSRPSCTALVNTYLNVYTTAIGDSVFDKAYRLTDTQNPHLLDLYLAEREATVLTAGDIAVSGVKIAVIS